MQTMAIEALIIPVKTSRAHGLGKTVAVAPALRRFLYDEDRLIIGLRTATLLDRFVEEWRKCGRPAPFAFQRAAGGPEVMVYPRAVEADGPMLLLAQREDLATLMGRQTNPGD
jgi:hypothetical protein